MKIALHWFRCDLRLRDNVALHAACADSDLVLPLFIFDPAILKAPETGGPAVAFMLKNLSSLQKDIARAGGRLMIRHGNVEDEMRAVIKSSKANALYFNRDYEPYARKRDAAVEKLASSFGMEVHSFKDNVIHEPDELLKNDGTPYKVFTPYSKLWRKQAGSPVLPAVRFKRPRAWKEPQEKLLPTLKELGFQTAIPIYPGGEIAARKKLDTFVAGSLSDYAKGRDFPAEKGTSGLSPYLRFGVLSPRTVLAAVDEGAGSHPNKSRDIETFTGELIWRDFYKQILWHFPHVADSCFKPKYNELKWENNEKHFAAWCAGKTGCPIVDAGMRQLNTTGWMHNRVRMITAMYLTKDLLVSWQWGERYFMQKLFDADLAANNGGWQWSSSTGTDAQPYFRIFNPVAQARKFDPEGRYIHRYVPEIDTPDYPKPIVDHAVQRVKALALFR